jgi:hypothetical protein
LAGLTGFLPVDAAGAFFAAAVFSFAATGFFFTAVTGFFAFDTGFAFNDTVFFVVDPAILDVFLVVAIRTSPCPGSPLLCQNLLHEQPVIKDNSNYGLLYILDAAIPGITVWGRGTPVYALVAGCGISAMLLLVSNHFDVLAGISVITTLIPYIFFCIAAWLSIHEWKIRLISGVGAVSTLMIIIAYFIF